MTAAEARGPKGCALGCLVIFLSLATFVLAGILLWRNPDWFDRLAFWRPRPYAHEVILVNDQAMRDAVAREDSDLLARAPRTQPEGVETLASAAVSSIYDLARGTRLTTSDGAVLEFPPGSLDGRVEVKLTPVTGLPKANAGPIAGPVYELTIGGREHADFNVPVRASLPYRPELFDAGQQPAVGVFENGSWRVLPSTVDAQNRIVSADLPHASLVGLLNPAIPPIVWGPAIGAAAVIAYGWVKSPTERGAMWSTYYFNSEKKNTQNFAIHYYLAGENATTQAFVDQLAGVLEQCRGKLDSVGMPVSAPILIRHKCFLVKLSSDGETSPGGPLFINAVLPALAGKDNVDPGRLVRATTAHELIHVAQEKYFGVITAWRNRWWLEATAPYLADRFWKLEGSPTDIAPTCYLNAGFGRLLKTPMDKTEEPDYYGYAALFRWLDRDQGNGFEIVRRVNQGGDASLTAIDATARSVLGGQGLGEVFTRFAKDFYHDDLWSGDLMPSLHRDNAPRHQALKQTVEDNEKEFASVTRAAGKDTALINPWSTSVATRLPHLSAQAFVMNVESLTRRGKLVVSFEMPDGPGPVHVYLATGTLGATLPSAGSNRGIQEVTQSPQIVEGIKNPGGIDRVTLLAVNPSLTEDRGAVRVERWLLVAPAFVESFRESGSNAWHVGWERSELADAPQVFGGYNVYRRKVGEKDEAYQKIAEHRDQEFYEDTAPDAEDYLYTVTVVDKLDNESEKAEVSGEDPFQGLWSGKVILEEGKISEPVMKWLTGWLGADRDPSSQRLLDQVRNFLDAIEKLLKVGIPVDIRIAREQNRYFATTERIFFKAIPSGETERKELERVGALSLMARGEKDDPPAYLQLYRPDQIRTTVRQEPPRGSNASALIWRIELARVER